MAALVGAGPTRPTSDTAQAIADAMNDRMFIEESTKRNGLPFDYVSVEEGAKVFKALCDPRRLAILEQLRGGEKCACVLLEKLDIRQPEHSWPSQEEVRSGKSVFGRAGDESNMTSIKLPYVMRLAWETNTTVSTMRCHKLVAEPLVRIFQATLDHYGMEKIRDLGQ